MARSHFARFGPAIDIVPVGNFSCLPLDDGQWADLWRLCGPSAEKNMKGTTRRPPLELWQVIAAAYLEGLHHGSECVRQQFDQPSP